MLYTLHDDLSFCQWYYTTIPRRGGVYPSLFTDPEGGSCFSIYQIRWIKKCCSNFFFWNFRETTRHFSLRSQNSEYPRILRVTGANQNAWKLLSTDLVNTKICYFLPLISWVEWEILRKSKPLLKQALKNPSWFCFLLSPCAFDWLVFHWKNGFLPFSSYYL